MGNPFSGLASHSAEYFGDTRDHWWNRDFIGLMARRWRLDEARAVLDVGCGVGHWGRVLAPELAADARVTGVDRDPAWIDEARRRVAREGETRFHFEVATAEGLPFADGAFDMVTCQTVLIHAADLDVTLAEMVRVLAPGGLLAVAEPNNVASSLLDADIFARPLEETVALVSLQLRCERGKAALGEGHNSSGELLLGRFARLGLTDVAACLSDKVNPLIPPYDAPEQRAAVDELAELAARDFWIWSRDDTRRYFLAGGGDGAAFDELWRLAMRVAAETVAAVRRGQWTSTGGATCYLVWGRKPG